MREEVVILNASVLFWWK